MLQAVKWITIGIMLTGPVVVFGADGDLTTDGGLESAGSLDWTANGALAQRVTTRPHSGQSCLRAMDNSESVIGHVHSKPVAVSLRGGGRFYAEAWVRVDTDVDSRTGYANVAVEVAFYDAAGKFVTAQNVGTTSATKWTRVSALITLPDEASLAAMRFAPAARVPQLIGAAFADDFYFAPLPQAHAAGRVKLAAAPKPPKAAPEYAAHAHPTDGANMALAIEKLTKGFDPPRPFVIWAIGSSFTEFLGSGDELIAMIREQFPDAPPIVYKTMVGGSTPYHLLRGWARHLVVPDRPDVVLIYNFGGTPGMDKLLTELRTQTTADIIVPTLHWCRNHQPVWPDPDADCRHVSPNTLRELCGRRGVEFVENRRDITKYMVDNKLEIADLLVDSVHQSPYAAKIINSNIAQHFRHAGAFSYDPRSRERRIEAENAAKSGDWRADKNGQAITGSKGATLTVQFTGTSIDLIGWRSLAGGSVQIWIDGKRADEAPVFHAMYVQPSPKNYIDLSSRQVDFRRVVSDRCPHGVSLGKNLVPQDWTITMTSDNGDYELAGSVTGPDGKGSALKAFTSASGQIIIEPNLWRLPKTNRTGDTFTFQVKRSAQGQINFAGAPEKFRARVVDNLPNGKHTLRLEVHGPHGVSIDAFDVFQPPER